MNDSSAATDSAKRRESATDRIAQLFFPLKSKARRWVKSPYVVGGVVIGAAAAGYFAMVRSAKPRAPSALRAPGKSLTRVLEPLKILLPLFGALSAATPPKRNLRTPPMVRPQSAGMAEKSPTTPALAVPRGGWFSQQLQLVKAALKAWSDDYAPSMGAALSYYTLFSIAPLLIVVIAVAGMVFGQEASQGAIVGQLRGIMGEEGAVAVEGLLKSAREPAKSIVATIGGIATLLLGSTAIFAELQSALDRIWRVPAAKKESGIWRLLRRRLLSFGLVLAVGFLLMISLVVSAALAALGEWWGGWLEGWDVFLEVLNFAVSFGIFTLFFAMIYKIMPRAKISWHDVWTGAAVTALLFTIGKALIGLYLAKSSLASGFGAAGSLAVLLVWVYYSAQIFLLGAEYTWVYAQQHGSRAQGPALDNAPAVPSRSGE